MTDVTGKLKTVEIKIDSEHCQSQASFINEIEQSNISEENFHNLQATVNRIQEDSPIKATSPALLAEYKGETVIEIYQKAEICNG